MGIGSFGMDRESNSIEHISEKGHLRAFHFQLTVL